MKKLILITLLLISSNAYATDWYCLGIDNNTDCALFYTDVALLTVDMAQTHDIKRHPGHYESNQYLGKYPSNSRINTYMVSWMVTSYLVNRYAPKWVRNGFNGGIIGVELGATIHNAHAGIKVRF